MRFVLIALSIILTCYFLQKRKLQIEPSIFGLTFMTIALACAILAKFSPFIIRGGGLPIIYTSAEMFVICEKLFWHAGFSIMFGCILVNLFLSFRFVNGSIDKGKLNSKFLERSITYYLVLTYLILAFYLLSNGKWLLQRNTYLYIIGGSINGNIHYYLPILSIISAYLIFKSQSKMKRVFLIIFAFICLLESFSSASRAASVQAMCITLILIFKFRKLFEQFAFFTLGTVFTLWATSLVLKLRTLDTHGLIPYLTELTNNPRNFRIDGQELVGNLISVIPTTYLGIQIPPPPNMLWIQISPFTGKSNGWYEIAGALMVNPATPSGAVAQIASLGIVAASIFWVLFGGVLTLVHLLYSRHSIIMEQKNISYILTFGALIQMLQYSVRIGMRFIYLNLIIFILIKVYSKYKVKNLLVN